MTRRLRSLGRERNVTVRWDSMFAVAVIESAAMLATNASKGALNSTDGRVGGPPPQRTTPFRGDGRSLSDVVPHAGCPRSPCPDGRQPGLVRFGRKVIT